MTDRNVIEDHDDPDLDLAESDEPVDLDGAARIAQAFGNVRTDDEARATLHVLHRGG